jgi:hypothetical protein
LADIEWNTHLSDGTMVEIEAPAIASGDTTVSADIEKYCSKVIECRLLESSKAVAAMRDGLTSIIPAVILSLFTWKELESRVCGQADVDVDLLAACTEYDEDVSPEDPHIVKFWQVLREFPPKHKRQFLRFVWARSRLPPTAAEFKQRFKIQAAVGESAKNDPDGYLPKAHTCFFSINLPRYTNKEIMKDKLLYAMYECTEMDADFRLTENEMTGWEEVKEDTEEEPENYSIDV